MAAYYNKPNAASNLLDIENINVNATDSKGNIPLDVAFEKKHWHVALKLIDKGGQALPQIKQASIIKALKALNYKITDGGVCYGIAKMAEQASFCHEADKFQSRVLKLHVITSMADQEGVPCDEAFLQTLVEKAIITEQELVDIHAFLNGVTLYMRPEDHPEFFTYTEKEVSAKLSQLDNQAKHVVKPVQLEGDDREIDRIKCYTGNFTEATLTSFLNELSLAEEIMPYI